MNKTSHKSTSRVITMAMQSFRRHTLMTIAATSVMALTLFSLLMVLVVRDITSNALEDISQRIDLVADVQETTSIDDVVELVRTLEARPDVSHVEYVSKDEALQRITSDDSKEDIRAFLARYNIENPLSAKLHIVTVDPSQHDAILTFLKQAPNDSLVSVQRAENDPDYQSRIHKLVSITHGIRIFGYFIVLLFAAIASLIIFNTIRITIHNRSDELKIMQLVGANTSFLQGPLLLESVFYGVLGTIVSTLVFFILIVTLGPTLREYFGEVATSSTSLGMVARLTVIQLLVSIVLGSLSAFVAMQRYLQKQVTL